MPSRSARTFVCSVTSLLVGASLSACAQRAIPGQTQPAPPAAVAVATIAGTVRELTYDADRNSMWWLTTRTSGTNLAEYSLTSGKVTAVALPALPPDGAFYWRVRVSPDGSIWVASGYTLVRYQPELAAMQSKSFPLRVAGALPGALDPNNPLPGTWISSMTFTVDGTALIARNHVPFLQSVTSDLRDGANVPLPAAAYDATDIGLGPGGLYYRSSRDDEALQSDTPPKIELQLGAAPNARPLLTDSAGSAQALRVTGSQGQLMIWNSRTGELTWRSSAAAQSSSLELPSANVAVPADKDSPAGSAPVHMHASVIAATFDSTGTLWYIESMPGLTQLMRATA